MSWSSGISDWPQASPLDWPWRSPRRLRGSGLNSLSDQKAIGSMQVANTALATKVEQLLTEARVIIPGAQALLGFQFIAMLTSGFDRLPPSVKGFMPWRCALSQSM
jgi:hypothetical protein